MLDPVITASSSKLRFEGFSGCGGVDPGLVSRRALTQ
jgi:hypothetical protein